MTMEVSSASKPVVSPPPPAKRVVAEQQSQDGNKVANRPEPQQQPSPKPVTNTQGQVTGQLLNVSA
jgi:hypothetical protein